MAELKPCPFCGKKPKIHYYPVNSGWAKCKPFFRKTHLMVVVEYAPPSQLKDAVVDGWNRMVDECVK